MSTARTSPRIQPGQGRTYSTKAEAPTPIHFVPPVPTFTAGSPSVTQLNQLSSVVGFLVSMDVRPYWYVYMSNSTPSLATGWNTVPYDHVVFDSDGVAGMGGFYLPSIMIVTQGYYSLDACVQVTATSAGSDQLTTAFKWTAGDANPYSAQSPRKFGYRGSKISNSNQGAADDASTPSDVTPIPMYPGDTLSVAVYMSGSGHTLDRNRNTSYTQGRFVARFSGLWVRSGS